jgi:hypothetical protein
VTTLIGGETVPAREKGEDDVSCVDANLIGSKMEKKITLSIQLVQMDGEDLNQ